MHISKAHHGGGYAYRLAPADGPLTEESFRKTPLDFVGNSILRWGGDKATQLEFNTTERGWETTVGTTPAGSTWRKFPVSGNIKTSIKPKLNERVHQYLCNVLFLKLPKFSAFYTNWRVCNLYC